LPPDRPLHSAPWYALRRTLPPHSFDANLRELIDHLPDYRVDEVIVKVDTEELTHGQPPLQWVRDYQPGLFEIRERMAEIGVAYSVNPWITMGHCDRGRDERTNFPTMGFMVGHDGSETICCACPLSETWREHVRAVWSLYAETRPRVMWVEDDIRTFNHDPVRFGCFCDAHLARFGEAVGQAVTRQQLVDALLQPGRPHPWREAWLNLQGQIMIETVGFLAQTVHAISPETHLGLMSSGPRNHCLEGRRWDAFANALADGRTLVSRPPMGNYSENSLRGLYYSQDSIKLTRHALPGGVVEQTEVENVPFTRYANSTAFTFLEATVSFALGCHGVTLNLFDHVGTPMQDEPWFGRLLADKKPFFAGLARRANPAGRLRGIQMLHHPQSSLAKHLTAGQDYPDLAEDGYDMMHALEGLGLATTYQPEPVAATSGQVIRAWSDEQIAELLGPGRGLLLDGPAAGVLVERGFGEEIGLADIAPTCNADTLDYVISAEEIHEPTFGGADRRYVTCILPNLGRNLQLCPLTPSPAARVVSSFVDADTTRRAPAMIACENARGGRVVVHSLDYSATAGIAFFHPHRQAQLSAVANWLWRGKLPATVTGGVWPWTFRMDNDGRTLLGLMNLSLDPWDDATFRLAETRRVNKLRRLSPTGRWTAPAALSAEPAEGGWTIRWNKPVPYHEPLFIDIDWA
jgi:hypothetical protein